MRSSRRKSLRDFLPEAYFDGENLPHIPESKVFAQQLDSCFFDERERQVQTKKLLVLTELFEKYFHVVNDGHRWHIEATGRESMNSLIGKSEQEAKENMRKIFTHPPQYLVDYFDRILLLEEKTCKTSLTQIRDLRKCFEQYKLTHTPMPPGRLY